MSQIAYQEALDPYHTLFRLLRVGRILGSDRNFAVDAIRIADFYLLFPFRIQGFRLKPEHRRFRGVSRSQEAQMPYGEFPSDRAVFTRMAPIQSASLATASRRGIIERHDWPAESVKFISFELPEEMERRITSLNDEQEGIADFLSKLVSEYEVTGIGGIKDRSGLLEHRYDSVA